MIFGITLHEVSHGYVAMLYGDPTAKKLGRLTLNPLKHIDPIGTILVPVIMLLTTSFIFGWAKPVPVNPRNLRNPKPQMAVVAAAGPLSNFLMAIFWVLLLKISIVMVQNQTAGAMVLAFMCQAGILINLVLMVLNLLPFPPLDGSKILTAFLPPPLDKYIDRMSLFGLLILVVLMTTGVLNKIMLPMLQTLQKFLFIVFNIT